MKELQELRNEILTLKNLEVLNKQQEQKLLLKTNAIEEKLVIKDVMSRLPDSDEIRQQAQQMDEKEFYQWWWETAYKVN